MRKRVQDYFDMGVQTVWIFNPETRTAHVCSATTMTEHKTGTLHVPGTKIELSIEEAFSTLDS
jgi:Uma2 family endonuclease